MNSSGRTIAKNASVLMASQVITFVLGLVLTIVIPRYLGPSAIGKHHLAVSTWFILSLFVTFGMDVLVTKEVARSPEKIPELFGSTIGLRVILFILSLGVLALFILVAGYPRVTAIALYMVGIYFFFSILSGAFRAILVGLEKMEYVSISGIISKAVATVLTVIFLVLGYGLFVVLAIGIVGAIVELMILLVSQRKYTPLQFNFSWDRAKWLLREGWPYLLTSMFLVIYMQIDVIIISLIVNDTTVGWYSTADHLFGTLVFIPVILMTAVFPALTRMYNDDVDSSSQFVRRSFHWLLLLGVPIGIGLLVISNSVVVLIFGPEFANSGPVLAVFGVVLIFVYLTTLLGQTLVAMDRQKEWAIVMAVATAATIVLDLLLIPWCVSTFGNGAIGGALAFIVTEGGMMVIGFRLLPKGTLKRSDAFFTIRVLIAGLVMGLVAWRWRDSFIVLPIVIGIVVYPLMLLILRAVPKQETAMVRWLVQSAYQRVRLRLSRSPMSG